MTADNQPLRSEQTMIPELELNGLNRPPVLPELGRLPVGSVQFGWVGVGPLGSRLAEWFYHLGYEKVIAVGSDEEHLERPDLPERQNACGPADCPNEFDSRETSSTDCRTRFIRADGKKYLASNCFDFPMLCLSEEVLKGRPYSHP